MTDDVFSLVYEIVDMRTNPEFNLTGLGTIQPSLEGFRVLNTDHPMALPFPWLDDDPQGFVHSTNDAGLVEISLLTVDGRILFEQLSLESWIEHYETFMYEGYRFQTLEELYDAVARNKYSPALEDHLIREMGD